MSQVRCSAAWRAGAGRARGPRPGSGLAPAAAAEGIAAGTRTRCPGPARPCVAPPASLLTLSPSPPPIQQAPKPADLSEAEQEALLRAKYGGLLKKKPLLPQDRKHFDSADWQLSKQGVPAPVPQLEPKLNPTAPPARRSSQLGDGQ